VAKEDLESHRGTAGVFRSSSLGGVGFSKKIIMGNIIAWDVWQEYTHVKCLWVKIKTVKVIKLVRVTIILNVCFEF